MILDVKVLLKRKSKRKARESSPVCGFLHLKIVSDSRFEESLRNKFSSGWNVIETSIQVVRKSSKQVSKWSESLRNKYSSGWNVILNHLNLEIIRIR